MFARSHRALKLNVRKIITRTINPNESMSLNDICKSVLGIPLSEHYGWRGALLFFQVACCFIYFLAAFVHRRRISYSEARKWDLEHVFMAASTLAALTAVVTWAFWMETNSFNVIAQTANEAKDAQSFARAKGQAWTSNAVYLIFKPVSIGL